MAKNCMQRRELKRQRLVARDAGKRKKLRAVINNPDASLEEKNLAQKKMQLLPRDSCKVRLTRRCWITGRAHGVYSTVGLARNKFREYAMNGDIPGLQKSSW